MNFEKVKLKLRALVANRSQRKNVWFFCTIEFASSKNFARMLDSFFCLRKFSSFFRVGVFFGKCIVSVSTRVSFCGNFLQVLHRTDKHYGNCIRGSNIFVRGVRAEVCFLKCAFAVHHVCVSGGLRYECGSLLRYWIFVWCLLPSIIWRINGDENEKILIRRYCVEGEFLKSGFSCKCIRFSLFETENSCKYSCAILSQFTVIGMKFGNFRSMESIQVT